MKILFVCLGNICRSPLAEGIMRNKLENAGLADKVGVDSAGFEPFHVGDNPDSRAITVGKKHGIDISQLTARLFRKSDFDDFQYIYVMDHNNYRDVIMLARNKNDQEMVDYVLNVVEPGKNQKVPDPWYGSMRDFEVVYTMLDKAAEAILKKIQVGIK